MNVYLREMIIRENMHEINEFIKLEGINHYYKSSFTLVTYALLYNNNILEYLIDKGANITQKMKYKDISELTTPLSIYLQYGNVNKNIINYIIGNIDDYYESVSKEYFNAWKNINDDIGNSITSYFGDLRNAIDHYKSRKIYNNAILSRFGNYIDIGLFNHQKFIPVIYNNNRIYYYNGKYKCDILLYNIKLYDDIEFYRYEYVI